MQSRTGSIGFGPIYDTMIGPQSTTPAFTTLFSFATELGASLNQTDLDFLARLLNRENVDTGVLDIWGSGQTTLPVGWRDVLPVYVDLPTVGDGATVSPGNSIGVINVAGDVSFAPGSTRSTSVAGRSPSRWTGISCAPR